MINEVNTDVSITNAGSMFFCRMGAITGFTSTEMGIMYIVTFIKPVAGITSSLFFESELSEA